MAVPLTPAQQRLVEDNLKLTTFAVRHYFPHLPEQTTTDLIADAHLYLVQAARCYRPDRGIKFSTYAVNCIRRNVWDWLNKRGPEARRKRAGVRMVALGRAAFLVGSAGGADERAAAEDREHAAAVVGALLGGLLDGDDLDVVKKRFGVGGADRKTHQEIGADWGCSHHLVRTREREVLAGLRERMAAS